MGKPSRWDSATRIAEYSSTARRPLVVWQPDINSHRQAMTFDPPDLRKIRSNDATPFNLRKIGHVVLRTSDMKKSVDFYVKVMGFSITDIYPEDMVPGGMVFMRFSVDHHGVALVGGVRGPSEQKELHHFAFEVDTL